MRTRPPKASLRHLLLFAPLVLGACDSLLKLGEKFGDTQEPETTGAQTEGSSTTDAPVDPTSTTTDAPADPSASTTTGGPADPSTTTGEPSASTTGGPSDPSVGMKLDLPPDTSQGSGDTEAGDDGGVKFDLSVETMDGAPCHPLEQGCLPGETCVYNPDDSGMTWLCQPDASGSEGQAFDVCTSITGCDPGLLCLGPSLGAECDKPATGCCLQVCDLSAPNTCPGAGQVCVPWYEAGTEPPGFENVGLCALDP